MSSGSESNLVELGERYAALGLRAAAGGAFRRAVSERAGRDATALRRLAEIAIAAGNSAAAREFAKAVVEREPGAPARVLLGRAQLASGELDAARLSFTAALEKAAAKPLLRARAHLGLAQVASAQGDRSGAAANAMASVDDVIAFAGAEGRKPADVELELTLAEESISRAVAFGRATDVASAIDAIAARRPEIPWDLMRAALLAARQASGDHAVSDGDVETALERALGERPGSRAARLRLAERRLRRRHRDNAARAAAIEALLELQRELANAAPSVAANLELARIYFLLAAAHEDDPGSTTHAEAAYRKGLKLRPGHAAAANRLALLTLARGDSEEALEAIERALRIDADHGLAWRAAARVLDASSPGPGLPRVVERLLDAAHPGAGAAAADVAPRLVAATAEVARGDVLAGMHARGHRLKNLLGIIGSRARSARKLAGEGELAERLGALEAELTSLYDEWSTYLRSMRSDGPVIEVLDAATLLEEVVAAAAEGGTISVELRTSSGLPDLRGDRVLLREALLNIVSNAVEACAPVGGRVEVSARVVSSGGSPVVSIEVRDTGPGIARKDLARVFAPGFTTKETGSGVGLAIAERVISVHHGRILLDSEEGRGTTITVVLPSDLGGFAGLAAFAPEPSPDEVE